MTGEDLAQAMVATYAASSKRLGRWFLDTPLHDNGRTWVLSKMWGTNTEPVLDGLLALAPAEGFCYQAVAQT